MNSPVLQLDQVTREFPEAAGQSLRILTDATLTVNSREVVAIQGRSGSGKSTLLNIMGLLDSPTAGRVLIDGIDATQCNDGQRSALRGESLGFVFQAFHLLQGRSAIQNVAEPLLFGTKQERRQRTQRARVLLERVGLGDRMHAMPNVLSGGEQQRVAIARALARGPGLILADEPTGSLDLSTGERIMELLLSLAQKDGTALVLVTHDDAIAAQAMRTLRLENGKIQETGT